VKILKFKLQVKKMEVRAKLVEEFCKELGSTNMVMGSLARPLCPMQDYSRGLRGC